VRAMFRAQFMGAIRLVVWTAVFLFGLAVTILRRLDVSTWATRLVHPHADRDALNRQAQVIAETSSAVDVARDNGMRLIEQCDAGSVATDIYATKAV
jgi:hypothetical protein